MGHIVGMRSPGLVSWLAAIALFAGGIALVAGKMKAVRMAGGVIAVVGLAGTIIDISLRSQPPPHPNLVITLVSPSRLTHDPLTVRVCGSTRNGAPTNPTAVGRHLLVTVDSVQMSETRVSTVSFMVKQGHHILTAQITSPYHQAYIPPIRVVRRIRVMPPGRETVPKCPG